MLRTGNARTLRENHPFLHEGEESHREKIAIEVSQFD